MTTDHDLLALVNDEELTLNRCLLPEEFHKPLRIANALRAVVAKEGWLETDIGTERELGYRMGYNQCLADIKADIEKELG